MANHSRSISAHATELGRTNDATQAVTVYRDSFVTGVSEWSAVEESTALPTQIFPVYVGSGRAAMGIDASGLQGLNHGVQEAFGAAAWTGRSRLPHTWPASGAGDLYIVRHGFVGDSISEQNVLPMGYLSWSLRLDDLQVAASNLHEVASLWHREIRLDTATVTTKMLIAKRLWFEIRVWMPYAADTVFVETSMHLWRFRPSDDIPDAHATYEIKLHLTDRRDSPLFKAASLSGSQFTANAEGHERYELEFSFHTEPAASLALQRDCVVARWNGRIGEEPTRHTYGLAMDGSPAASMNPDALRQQHQRSWSDHYQKCADIRTDDSNDAYLFHNSMYLIRSGINSAMGAPISLPFSYPPQWKASTFWDSHFVMDALLAVGNHDTVVRFLELLRTIARDQGAPFPWMFLYDGTPTIEPEADQSPLVIAAHAMSAIKAYEYTLDRELLGTCVYPICRSVANFAVNDLFVRDEDGWILRPVTQDVTVDDPAVVNNTFTALWLLVVLKKAAEYGEMLGSDRRETETWLRVVGEFELERSTTEYLHGRGVSAGDFPMASFVPFLMYPTEGSPLLDRSLMEATRGRYDFNELYLRKQGDIQPWTSFIQALSDLRRGAQQDARRSFDLGMTNLFGTGLFSEVAPQRETVGLPPYLSAHGAYLAFICYRLVGYSLWSQELGLFTGLTDEDLAHDWTFERICAPRGLVVSGRYTPRLMEASLSGSVGETLLRFPMPVELRGRTPNVEVNGIRVHHDIRGGEITVGLPAGIANASVSIH